MRVGWVRQPESQASVCHARLGGWLRTDTVCVQVSEPLRRGPSWEEQGKQHVHVCAGPAASRCPPMPLITCRAKRTHATSQMGWAIIMHSAEQGGEGAAAAAAAAGNAAHLDVLHRYPVCNVGPQAQPFDVEALACGGSEAGHGSACAHVHDQVPGCNTRGTGYLMSNAQCGFEGTGTHPLHRDNARQLPKAGITTSQLGCPARVPDWCAKQAPNVASGAGRCRRVVSGGSPGMTPLTGSTHTLGTISFIPHCAVSCVGIAVAVAWRSNGGRGHRVRAGRGWALLAPGASRPHSRRPIAAMHGAGAPACAGPAGHGAWAEARIPTTTGCSR